MRKVTPKLEWQFIENDAEWARQQLLLAPTVTPRTGYRLYLQTYAGTLIALLLVIGGVWWYVFQGKEEKTAAIGTTTKAQYTATDSTSAIDGTNTNPDGSERQLLTGNITAGQNTESLATPYFIYHFRPQDGAVVHALAPSMDGLYLTVWHNLGLPMRPMPKKLVIDVALERLPGQAVPAFAPVTVPAPTHYLMPGEPPTEPNVTASVTVPSPARYLAPVALSEVDLLAQSIALPLVAYGLAQAREQHQIGPAWQPLLDGLYLWQVWDLDLPLATWRETVVQWQYHDLPSMQPGEALSLPRYQEFCAVHKRWLQSPTQIHIPLVCSGQDGEGRHWNMWRAGAPLTTLEQLNVPLPMAGGSGATSSGGPPFFTDHPGQSVALATLIEYGVATYGRESLSRLLAALGNADSWETLLPAVFGVSATEFEAGWQAYLAGQYGVPLDALR